MIYLDYAATAPLRPSIAEALNEIAQETLGNPSSLHRAGRKARFYLEEARERCANLLGAKVEEIVFCSGATEADNLALRGPLNHGDIQHHGLITSRIEHAAVYETAQAMEEDGETVSWMEVSPTGEILLDSLERSLQKNPKQLVSVMAVNNEVGTRQPVEKVSSMCRTHGALLHVDAVQAPHQAKALIGAGAVDLVTLSGHKMGGLPGGLLYVRQGVPLAPQILGGSQEDGRRAGTSEVFRAVSVAGALEATLSEDPKDVASLRDLFEQTLTRCEAARLLGPSSQERRAPHISAWLFDGLGAEPILTRLDLLEICASSGSACSSHAVEPSRVVSAMGYDQTQSMGLVRFSFGWKSTREEVQRAAEVVLETIEKMKKKDKIFR